MPQAKPARPGPVTALGPDVAKTATSAVGPATAALYEKQAARKAVLDEASAKLRAISDPAPAAPVGPAAEVPEAKRKRRDVGARKPMTPVGE